MRWSGLAEWSERPVVVVVDRAGGPLDQLAADPDLATFLNDRFQAWFISPEAAPPPLPRRGVVFTTPEGCRLAGPLEPASADAWIAAANEVLLEVHGGAPGQAWEQTPSWTALSPPSGHPLRLGCAKARP